MKKCTMALSLLIGCGVHVSFGNLLLNGDFSSSATEDFQIELSDADLGWRTDAAGGGWDTGAGAAVARVLEEGIGQVVSVGSASGNQLELSFDWTPGSGASANELAIGYYLLAWDETGTAVANADFFGNHNASALEGRDMVETLSGQAAALDIAANTLYPDGGTSPWAYGAGTQQEVSSGAGVVNNYSQTFTISNGIYDNIDDFDYVGIMFFQPLDSEAGSTLDNVSLTVVIPEPATFGLVALFGGALAFFRRKSMG